MSKFIFSPSNGLAKIILVCVVTIGGFLFGGILGAEAADSGDVVINEVMYAPTTAWGGQYNEWIELYNNSDTATIITGWTIDNKEIPEASISKNSYLIIARNDVEFKEVYPEVNCPIVKVAISLLNDGETIVLKEDSEINSVDYTSYTEENLGKNGKTLELDEDGNWKESTSEGGTPGQENSTSLPNESPQANAGEDQTVYIGQTITFDGSGSFDEDGEIASFEWDFGDSSSDSGETVEHSYSKAGTYTVTLTVTDDEGAEDPDTLKVTVNPLSKDIIINEVLPSPETDWNKDGNIDQYDEFIELYNKGSSDIDLENWIIGDSTTQKYVIKDLSIKTGQYSVIYRSDYKFALNDTGGDCIKLYHPDSNEPLDSVCYTEKAEKNMAYALNKEGKWSWTTTPTPEKENIITSAEEEGEEEEDEEENDNDKDEEKKDEDEKEAEEEIEKGKSKEHPKELSISEVRKEEKGVWVKVKGIVTCPPGVLSGSVIFYIQDGKTGIKIYSSKEDLPEIKLGDEIEVTGKTSEAQGEKKINIQNPEDVTVVSHKDLISARSVKTGEIGEEYEGLLVIISGKVVSLHGSTFYIDDGSGRIKVSIKKSTGIDKPEMQKEEEVTIIGIVSEAYEAYRILPRFQEDVRLGKVEGVESEDKEKKLAKTGTSIWQIIAIACLITGTLFIKKNKLSFS